MIDLDKIESLEECAELLAIGGAQRHQASVRRRIVGVEPRPTSGRRRRSSPAAPGLAQAPADRPWSPAPW